MHATVRDVMSTHVIAVRQSAPYKEMAAMLHLQRVSAFPVVDDDDKVIGVVSEGDLLTKQAFDDSLPGVPHGTRRARDHGKASAITAAELMSKPAVTIGPDAPVTQAARLMYSRRVKRLPVVNDDGKLIGIVTRADLLSVYSRPDADIQREIAQDLILGVFQSDPDRFAVVVKDGIVTIDGTPETAPAGHDIIDAAKHVEGVVAVRDRLSYPPDAP